MLRALRKSTTYIMVSLLTLGLIFSSDLSERAYAASESVSVDLSQSLGAPTYRGTGFLYGLNQDGSAPIGGLLSDLKPKLFRGGGASLSGGGWAVGGYSGYLPRFNEVRDQYNRANALGAKYQILVSDIWGSFAGLNPEVFPGDNGDWTYWNQFLTQLVQDKIANNMTNARYDIWNEPDGAYFWDRTSTQYFEMWKRGVQLIRSLDPNAVIVGPSYGGFNANQLSSWLDYAKSNNVLPNILDWHFSADPVADVQTAQSLLTAKSITQIQGFTIGEYIWSQEQNSGYTAWYLARLEKSGVLGANHAIWDHCCSSGLLDDTLTTSSEKKGQWWTYKAYADMTGTIVNTSPSAHIDGVASKDASKASALILLGNKGGQTGDIDVNINRLDTASYLIGSNGKAHVVVSLINNIDPVAAPVVTQSFDATVVNNSIKLIIPWNYALDAYTISITPSTGTQSSNVYEAENAALSGGAKVMTDHTGYSGTAFVAGYEAQGASTQFTVQMSAAGSYNVNLRYGNGSGTMRTLSIYVNGSKIQQTSLAATSDWDTWATKTETISLQAGSNTIAYKYDPGDNGLVNLDKITINSTSVPDVAAIPGKIEAENYNYMWGVQTETTSDTGGGLNVGWIDNGDWMDYAVNVLSTSAYTVSLRVASGISGGQLQVRDGAGSVLSMVSIPNTGGWQTWTTVTSNVSLPAGNQILRLYAATGGFNVNWMSLATSAGPLSLVYQAENNTILSGGARVMTDHANYFGSGFVAGYELQGASTKFTVNVPSQGLRNVALRYANGSGTQRTVSIYVNGVKIRQTALPQLASWDAWGTKTESLNLLAGNNTIEYKYDTGDNGLINLDQITIS
ncbi:carbohydrate-binding protein [Cohnella endophytica]|uniref:Carbohydrate-binding protein n=1 Tax=Cohnella endophytica TaxID=2419778 RepID=A0A494Y3G0_9BACL|nr:carbohydrate-binding protein [Cohnella endophytica]RKP54446.1 carbohydrate-binding protein [Cohnella endophytica]